MFFLCVNDVYFVSACDITHMTNLLCSKGAWGWENTG